MLLRPLQSLPTLKCCPFCNSGHPSLRLPRGEGGTPLADTSAFSRGLWISYLIVVVASQQDEQRQGQGDVGTLGDILLRQLPLQTPRTLLITCHPLFHSHDLPASRTGHPQTLGDPTGSKLSPYQVRTRGHSDKLSLKLGNRTHHKEFLNPRTFSV